MFFYNQTKFFVGACGGFAFGWFLEAVRESGLTDGSIVGRWGLIGGEFKSRASERRRFIDSSAFVAGLSVLFFILGLIPTLHHHVLLTSTALIGATAFTLGIDCFTRAGLKEFYIYNLGYRSSLFPKLLVQQEGMVGWWKFPLLTVMQVELGVLAAAFLVSRVRLQDKDK